MAESKNTGAFFDLDNTLIRGATLLIVAPTLHKLGLISGATLVRAGIGAKVFEHLGATEARVNKFKNIALDIVDGWNHDEIIELMEGTLDRLFLPRIHTEAMTLVHEHQQAGHIVAVISSSPYELVKPIAAMFGIGNVIATQVRLDTAGRYTKEFEQWVSGKAKPDAVLNFAQVHGIDLKNSFGYSDSRTDLEFMRLMGHPICVNPDSRLAREAAANGWEVREFADPRAPRNIPAQNLLEHRLTKVVAGVSMAGLTAYAGAALSRRFAPDSAR